VVNIGSIGGKRPYPNRTPYAASKMALIGLTRTLAYELGRDDVTVNTVLPGPVEGDRIEEVVEKQARLADVENAEPASTGPDDFPLPDFTIPPGDVAEQVAYLAGPHARKVTGQEIAVDAGGTWY
jgi:NAD(P)-dependent dehydrogenase (short-subunit alcohol dehydrogenase family)